MSADNPASRGEKLSRRGFLTELAVIGGILAVGSIVGYSLYSLVENAKPSNIGGTSSENAVQEIVNPSTNNPVKTSDLAENSFLNFVYPRSTTASLNSNTFAQFVLIHLPKGFTAPKNLGVVDPVSGDTFIAFSRVCVHLWCLCTFDTESELIACPCHGSQFVAGQGPSNNELPGTAISGPAAQQKAPNNTLPVATLVLAPDGTISATGIVGQVGCGQGCANGALSSTVESTS